jgi:hypothetical protein
VENERSTGEKGFKKKLEIVVTEVRTGEGR